MINKQEIYYKVLDDQKSVQIDVLNLIKGIKVKNAFLFLKVKNITQNAVFEANFYIENTKQGLIDKISNLSSTAPQNEILLNITDEIQYLLDNEISVGVIKFETSSNYSIEIEKSYEKSAIYYLMPASYEENTVSYNSDIGNKENVSINLGTGEFTLKHSDFDLYCNSLSLPIKHVYSSKGVMLPENENIKSLYGHNVKLNIEQYLEEVVDNEELTGEYILYDENGKQERLLERFYYFDDSGDKVYIERGDSNLRVNLNGELEYLIHEELNLFKPVYLEIKTKEGFSLVTDKKDIKGANLISSEPDEMVQLREQIKSLEANEENLKTIIENSQNQLVALVLSKKVIEKQINEQQTATGDSTQEIYKNILTESQFTELLSSVLNIGNEENKDYEYFLKDENGEFLITNYYNLLKDSNNEVKLANKDLLSIDMQIKSTCTNIENYRSQLKDTFDTLEKMRNSLALYERQIPVFYLYNDSVIYGFSKIINENTTTTYINGNNEFKTEYLSIPHIYRLNYIQDNYDNTIIINYQKNINKIDNIVDSNNNVTTFVYDDNDLLVDIVSQNENKMSFSYLDNKLIDIKSDNNKLSRYVYSNDNLIGVISNKGIRISYDTSSRVSKIQGVSILNKIENADAHFKTETIDSSNIDNYLTKNIVKFDYINEFSTSVSSVKCQENNEKTIKKLTYIFDNIGRVRTVYENSFDENNFSLSNPVVKSFNYLSREKRVEVSPLLNAPNYLDGVCFTNGEDVTQSYYSNYFGDGLLEGGDIYCGDDVYCESYLVHKDYHSFTSNLENLYDSVEVNAANLQEINSNTSEQKALVLSGFAKANSYFIYNEDNTDKLITDFPAYISNRKFELRAQVTYSGEMTPHIFKKCFDFKNNSWQFCALLVPIDASKEVQKIECFFDYSNNNTDSPVYFTDLVLKQASFVEETLKNNKLVERSTSNSKWKQKYYYNDDDKLIKIEYYDKTKNTESSQYFSEFFYNKFGKLFKTINYNNIVTEKIFNDKGVEIKSKIYHKNTPSDVFYTEQKLDDNGKILSSYNSLGDEINNYQYDKGNISNVIDFNNNITSYAYDSFGNTLQMSNNADGISNITTYNYTLDFLTKLNHNNFDILYDYDSLGRVSKIKVDNENYITLLYDDSNNTCLMTYSNDSGFKSIFDDNGNVVEVYFKDKDSDYSLILQNIYDSYGNLIAINDKIQNSTIKYVLDKFDNESTVESTQHGITLEKNLEYDSQNNLSLLEYTLGTTSTGNAYCYTYEYNDSIDSELKGVMLPTGALQSLDYDSLGRTKEISLVPNMESNLKISKLHTYLKKGNHASNLVSSLWFGENGKYKDNLKYTYDKNGNITQVKNNGQVVASYQYDALNRLVREDNKFFNKSTIFEYDAGGNIVNKLEYNYSCTNLQDKTPNVVIPYNYATSGNRDRLMSYDGEAFEYDAIGNPTKYRDLVLEWSGRQLKKYGTFEFEYNAQGVRTKKISGNTTTNFFLDGTKILAQEDIINSDNTSVKTIMHFFYGVDGVAGFTINNQNYYYKKNLQGDIIGIYDNNMNQIVKYEYDAWGEHKIYYLHNNQFVDIDSENTYTENSNTLYIALKNPFRYRSYYYDLETGLYYLNSRYYDPELGRFVNVDGINYLDTNNINGLNLYAYCLNNPIMLTDSQGTGWLTDAWNNIKNFFVKSWEVIVGTLTSAALVIGGIALTIFSTGFLANFGGAMIGAGIGGFISGVQSQLNGSSYWAGYLGGVISGGLAGFGSAIGPITSFFLGGFGNFIGTIVTGTIDTGEINWNNIENFVADSLIVGLISIGGHYFGKVTDLLNKFGFRNIFSQILIWSEMAFTELSNSIITILKEFTNRIKQFLNY